ncbi:MAG: polysaccharide deacetylase family protein, partial [Eubacteriales bacterium]|nr:polysaccharide deacetylase family protein [Eubacteriales bacterium]
LPGFTRAEIKQLDKKGMVLNGNNMVFLTFDDWGTDRAITEILNVLERHNAKATFFVRTKNVAYNPNLLRAIAAAGHTIGDHTHTHLPLSIDTGSGRKFTELTDEEALALQKDVVTSYDLLQSIIGDMKTNGHPSLSLLFRPPTLAVGKKGLTTVLDCGFSYSVSGSYSTQDYKATNATKLAAQMKANTKSGVILVMHMSDNSIYTAQALDIYLSEMENKYAENPLKFVGLSEVLK